jgi:hypothetical protein
MLARGFVGELQSPKIIVRVVLTSLVSSMAASVLAHLHFAGIIAGLTSGSVKGVSGPPFKRSALYFEKTKQL